MKLRPYLWVIGLSFVAFFLNSLASAAEKAGVTVPESITWKKQSLNLNGMGLRLATVFKVKVYVASLYVEKPSHEASDLIASTSPLVLDLHFVREVSRGKIVDAWTDSFEKNCGSTCETQRPQLEALKGLTWDMKDQSGVRYVFESSAMEVYEGDALKGRIEGKDFRNTILSVFLVNPPNRELRDGLLGK
jgi:hypothetical protein